jgi:hypothetical protein
MASSKLRCAANIDPDEVNWARYFFTTDIGYVPEQYTRDYRRDRKGAQDLYGVFTPLTEQDLKRQEQKLAEKYAINIDTDFDPFAGVFSDADSPPHMVPIGFFEDEHRRELRYKLHRRTNFVFLPPDCGPAPPPQVVLCEPPPPPSPTEQEQALFLATCMVFFDEPMNEPFGSCVAS